MQQNLFQTLIQDSLVTAPLLGWVVLGLGVLIVQMVVPKAKVALMTGLGGLSALLLYSVIVFDSSLSQQVFFGLAVWDSLAQFFNILSLLICLAVGLMMIPGMSEKGTIFEDAYRQFPEFMMCMIFAGFGVSAMAVATDLTSLFLSLEIVSIALYGMVGFYRKEIKSTEAALKYLLIGAFATVLFLYGLAFIYGATGATSYQGILSALSVQSSGPVIMLGVFFLIAGLGFKLALVPFHLYAADVYEGAPTPVSAFLSTIVKVGVAAAGIRIFWGFLIPVESIWEPLWMGLCVLSILIGNLAALQQRTMKRLLAFSSISHGGFIGLALLIGAPAQLSGSGLFPLLAYLVVYSALGLGSFGLVHLLEKRDQPFLVEDLKGLAKERLGVALLFAIFLFSLAGVPPFAGFIVKFWIFQGLVQSGAYLAAILAVVGSVIGAAYYLRLLIYIFVSEERGRILGWSPTRTVWASLGLVIVLTALLTTVGGLRPQIYADWILSVLALK
jgi:NADH-quinone oxidoreductase subunit N